MTWLVPTKKGERRTKYPLATAAYCTPLDEPAGISGSVAAGSLNCWRLTSRFFLVAGCQVDAIFLINNDDCLQVRVLREIGDGFSQCMQLAAEMFRDDGVAKTMPNGQVGLGTRFKEDINLR
jgi:hypothetical protein